ncbi:MAG: phage tail protein [Nitrososphaerales archaeon]
MAVGNYVIKIGGTEYDNWKSFSTDETLDLNNNQGTITYPDFEPLKNVGFVNQDVQILRDGVLCWRGIGMKYESVVNQQNIRDWNLGLMSNKIYLTREAFRKGGSLVYAYGGTQTSNTTLTTQATLCKQIFLDVLACQYTSILSAGIIDVVTNYPHVTMLLARTTAMYALQNLINASLWETRFNPDNTVDFQQHVGSQTPVFSFVEGMNILDFKYQYGIDQFVNDSIVLGAGSATGTFGVVSDNQVVAEPTNNASSLASFGRWSKIYSFNNIYDVNTLTAYANALQVDLETPLYTLNLLVTIPVSGVPFKIGDVVSVTSQSLGLAASQYRIIEIKRQYDASSGEQITLSVQPNARLVSLTHARLKALEFILNSQTLNQQLFSNTVNGNPSQIPQSVVTAAAYVVNEGSGFNSSTTLDYVTTDAHLTIQNTGTANQYTLTVEGTVAPGGTGAYNVQEVLIIDNTTGAILYDSGSSNMGTDSGKKTITITNNINGHDIIFRMIGVGVYAFANASWTQNVYGWLNGTSETAMTCHAGIGITGQFNGGTLKIEVDETNIALSSTTLQITDATTSVILYTNSAASSNTEYDYTLSSDTIDHDIEFNLATTAATPSAYPASIVLKGMIALTAPIVPT